MYLRDEMVNFNQDDVIHSPMKIRCPFSPRGEQFSGTRGSEIVATDFLCLTSDS